MYLTQALHKVFLKGGPEGPLEVEVAALLQSLSSYVTLEDINNFWLFFLLYRVCQGEERCHGRRKRSKTDSRAGSATNDSETVLFVSADKRGSDGYFRELSRSNPPVSRNPGWTFTGQTSTATVCLNHRFTTRYTASNHRLVGTCKPPVLPDKLLVSAPFGIFARIVEVKVTIPFAEGLDLHFTLQHLSYFTLFQR